MEPMQLVIGGERVRTTNHREIRNPSTGAVVGLMPLASEANLDQAVRKAAIAFDRVGSNRATTKGSTPAARSPALSRRVPRSSHGF